MRNDARLSEESFSQLPWHDAMKLCTVWTVASSHIDPYTKGLHPSDAGDLPQRPALLPSDAYCLAELVFPAPDKPAGHADVSWCIELASMLALCNSRTPTVLLDWESLKKLSAAQLRRRGLRHPLELYCNLQLYRPVVFGKDQTEIDDEALRILAWNASVPQCRQFAKYMTADRISEFLNFVARNGDVELFFEALSRSADGIERRTLNDKGEADDGEHAEDSEGNSNQRVQPATSHPVIPFTGFHSGRQDPASAKNAKHWHTAGALLASVYQPSTKDVLRWMSTASANGHSKLLALLFQTYGIPTMHKAKASLIIDATESGAVHLLSWLHAMFPTVPLDACFNLTANVRAATLASIAAQCGHIRVLDWLSRTKKVEVIPRHFSMVRTWTDGVPCAMPRTVESSIIILPHVTAARANQVAVLEWLECHALGLKGLVEVDAFLDQFMSPPTTAAGAPTGGHGAVLVSPTTRHGSVGGFPAPKPHGMRRLFHYAAEWGAVDALRWMAARGIDIWTPDNEGETIETLIARHKNPRLIASVQRLKVWDPAQAPGRTLLDCSSDRASQNR